MAIPLQLRRGTKAQNDVFTGALGEVTVDTENKNLRLHDGSTAGGVEFPNSTNALTGFKNHIINGDFSVNQRGDIDTAPIADDGIGFGAYYIDRFILQATTSGTIQRFVNQVVDNKVANTVKVVADLTTVDKNLGIRQFLENFHTLQTLTASVWVKSNNSTTRIGMWDGVNLAQSTTHSGSGLWEKLTLTYTVDASASTLYMDVVMINGITSGDYIESTMWQLEEGNIATPFEQRPIGLELSLCQRYYEYQQVDGSSTSVQANAGAPQSYTFMVEKRVLPTMTKSGGSYLGSSNQSVSPSNKGGFVLSTSGVSTGQNFRWTNVDVFADAEL